MTFKIGYFGDGPWASNALERLSKLNGLQISFIVPRYETRDPELARWAKCLGVPFLPIENVNDPANVAQLALFDTDLFVSMSFNQILRTGICSVPRLGFINCHAGRLPFYRGRNPLNWVLVNGEKEFGVTVHWVDEGIDTGDIIVQRLCPISATDTYAQLLTLAQIVCADALTNAITALMAGTAERRNQCDINSVGTYFSMRRNGDEWIDWNWPSTRIHNLVRAISAPGPGALTSLAGELITIESVVLVEGAPSYIATCGEIIGRRADGVVVKTGDTSILVKSIRTSTGTGEVVPRWPIGTRLLGQTERRLTQCEMRIAELEDRLRKLDVVHSTDRLPR